MVERKQTSITKMSCICNFSYVFVILTHLISCYFVVSAVQLQDLNPKVREMYEGVRDVLAKYRSGKLPKAFKIIPSLKNWEQILYLTG